MNVLWSMEISSSGRRRRASRPLHHCAELDDGDSAGDGARRHGDVTVRAVSILAIGSLLFDVHFAVENVPLLAAVFCPGAVALYGMGMMFASMFLMLAARDGIS